MLGADQVADVVEVVEVALDRRRLDVGSTSETNWRTVVIPMTPPDAAIVRMAASVLVRGCPPASARQLECVNSTGLRDSSQASSVV